MISTLWKTAVFKSAPLNAIPRRFFAASKGFNYQLL
jgi:isovaleryl-CoA dehydrogenase